MHWTKKVPDSEGHFWIKREDEYFIEKPRIVEIIKEYDGTFTVIDTDETNVHYSDLSDYEEIYDWSSERIELPIDIH